MWILAAAIGVLAMVTIWQSEFGGGLDRPWAECRENIVRQMLFNECTPREGGFRLPPPAADAPRE